MIDLIKVRSRRGGGYNQNDVIQCNDSDSVLLTQDYFHFWLFCLVNSKAVTSHKTSKECIMYQIIYSRVSISVKTQDFNYVQQKKKCT